MIEIRSVPARSDDKEDGCLTVRDDTTGLIVKLQYSWYAHHEQTEFDPGWSEWRDVKVFNE